MSTIDIKPRLVFLDDPPSHAPGRVQFIFEKVGGDGDCEVLMKYQNIRTFQEDRSNRFEQLRESGDDTNGMRWDKCLCIYPLPATCGGFTPPAAAIVRFEWPDEIEDGCEDIVRILGVQQQLALTNNAEWVNVSGGECFQATELCFFSSRSEFPEFPTSGYVIGVEYQDDPHNLIYAKLYIDYYNQVDCESKIRYMTVIRGYEKSLIPTFSDMTGIWDIGNETPIYFGPGCGIYPYITIEWIQS